MRDLAILKKVYDRLMASPGNMANTNSFWSITKRGNSGLRVTRAKKMGVQDTKEDLLDAIATSLTQNQNENNVDFRMRRDDPNEKLTAPSNIHMLRMRKSFPNINQAMAPRMRRHDPNEKLTAPSNIHMLRMRKSFPNINQAMAPRMRRDDPNETFTAPSTNHMLRVRKSFPNINHAMAPRMRRDDTNETYTGARGYHMLRVRKTYRNPSQAMAFRVTRGEKRALPKVYGRI